jgi:YD repeat-containing protein
MVLANARSVIFGLVLCSFISSIGYAQQVPLGNGLSIPDPAIASENKPGNTSKPDVSTPHETVKPTTPAGEPAAIKPDVKANSAQLKNVSQQAFDKSLLDAQTAAPAPAAALGAAGDFGGAVTGAGTNREPTMKFGADGALRYSYDIDVPAYHDLEPAISLNYDSGRKTKLGAGYQGWLGFGWGLDGFDVIERQRPRGGVPAFDQSIANDYLSGNDVYVLNGSEMVPCAVNSPSPSCQTGGNFSTEVESYQRVKLDKANLIWTVTQRDGTQLLFYPAAYFVTNPTGDGYLNYYSKWFLQRVIDTNGNTITYTYDCPKLPVCYPKAVSYGPYTVNFNMEERPDFILMANGKSISSTEKRIKSITTKYGASLIAAWKLTYAQAANTGTTRLVSVQKFGRDAVIDAAGAVTGPTSLPPVAFSYRDFNTAGTGYDTRYQAWERPNAAGCGGVVLGNGEVLPGVSGQLIQYSHRGLFSDINNDGADEFLYTTYSCPTANPNPTGDPRPGAPNSGDIPQIKTFFNKFNFNDVDLAYTQTLLRVQPSIFMGASSFLTENAAPMVGSFLGSQQNKSILIQEFAVSTTRSNQETYYNYSPIHSIFQFDNLLNPTRTYCSAITTGPLATNCAALSQGGTSGFGFSWENSGRVAVDIDGATKVSKIPNRDWGFAGNGDFSGDGILRPVITIGQDVTAVYVYETAAVPVLAGAINLAAVTRDLPNRNGASDYTKLVDINGDGLTDVLFVWPAVGPSKFMPESQGVIYFRVFLSTGSSFSPLNSTPSIVDFTSATIIGGWSFADIDGDGKINLVGQSTAVAAHQTNANFIASEFRFGPSGNTIALNPAFAINADRLLGYGDVNGDGLPDFPVSVTGTTIKFLMSGGTEGLPGSLFSVKNEFGGDTFFKFTPSTRWVNTFMPFASSTLTEIAADDGRGNIAKQKISYAGGKYDPALRRSFGFRTVTETRPCTDAEMATCPNIETTYRQDVASAGAVERRVEKDGAGVVRSDTNETWAVNATAKPYTAQNTATTTTLTENGGSATLKTERFYDGYGNVTLVKDYGRTDATGDELMTYLPVTPNTTSYIVDKPYQLVKWAGLDSSSPNYVEYQQMLYDGLAFTAAPARGEVTTQRVFQSISPAQVYSDTVMTYDGAGNVLTVKDPVGNVSTTTYDANNLFAVSQTNAKGQVTTINYGDYVCGQPVGKTGIDTIAWTFDYDELCRPLKQTNTKSGQSTSNGYGGFGTPTNQYVYTSTPHAGGYVTEYSYFSGFGDVYRQTTEATAFQNGVQGTTEYIERRSIYDARGNVTSKSLPYYTGETPRYITTTYDWADRPLVTTMPDGATRSKAYWVITTNYGLINPGLFYEVTTDELQRQTHVWNSSRGQPINIKKQLGAGWQSEYRTYDALNRLTGITDEGGATWANVYDMAGNRLSATDPDLGTWGYTYDRNNRLATQTDSRGVKTGMSYDALGRLTERKILSPIVPNPVLATNTYDQPKANFYNIGKLTSSTNAIRSQTFDYDANGFLYQNADGGHYS